MTYTTIVSTEILENALNDPNWVICDCRFDLPKPEWGYSEYISGHIPGAIYVNVNKDLSGPPDKHTGRHPLPDPDEFIHECAQWGINRDSQVVVYDQAGGSFAARLWWLLGAIGHPDVSVLDGGFAKWSAEKRPIKAGIEKPHPASTPELNRSFNLHSWMTSGETEKLIENPGYRLIDARSPDRYRGENEIIDPIAGHIPGAVNRFYGLNLRDDGTFKSPDTLRQEFLSLLDGKKSENSIVYCGSGITACHHLLALEIAGLKGARLYAGSWSEWIRDPNRPRWQP